MIDKQLRNFLLIVQEGSMTRAASLAFLSPPALKGQMDQLEAELGATLFVRSNRGIQLTEAGKCFEAYAREVTEKTETLRAQISGGG